ncbi:MAG: TonB-dependent receptor [Gammaproteobacteria bacterium]|nr:TonB-dependent receptor [Gammaproteobacteria bacterium]
MSSFHHCRGNVLAAVSAIPVVTGSVRAFAAARAARGLACVALLAIAVPAGAGAATAPGSGMGAGVDEPLQEVIVTASLRRDRLAELPASVTVLDAATVRGAGVQHLQDLLPLVPNLNWASGSSRPRYFQLRGIGETDQWQGAPNPSVGFLIDGMDFSGIGMPATLFDVEQVEVLRGPQGTTYGANALAGLINVGTRRASRKDQARLELTGGDYGSRGAGAVFGGALGEHSAGRLVAQRYRSDGFRENLFLGRDDTGRFDETTLRARLALAPWDGLDVDVSALWVDLDNGYDAFALDNSRRTYSDQPGRDAQRSRGLSAALDWRATENVTLRSVSAVTESDIVYSFDGDWGFDPGYDFTQRFLRRHRTVSQDLRLMSDAAARAAGGFAWLGGLYVLDVRETNDQLDLYDGDVFRALQSRYDATNVAAYGQLEWRPRARWRLTAGLRAEQRDARYRDSDGSDFVPRDRMLGGHLAAEYALSGGSTAYVTLSRGYKAGGFNIGPLIPDDRRLFDPEFLRSVELGWRLRGAEGRAALDAALFFMRRSDLQVGTSAQLDPGDPLSFVFVTDNAAEGENWGAELTASWRATEALRVGATLGLLRSRYLGYRIGARDLDGRDQAHAPRTQYTLSLEYRDPRGPYARADLQGVDAFYFSESHDQRSRPYRLLNLRAGWAGERWDASLWVRNALDADWAQRGFFFGNEPPDFPDRLYVQPGDPRQAGVTVTFDLR